MVESYGMAKLIVVLNWKNYPSSLDEATALLKEMGKRRSLYKKVSMFIAPPYPYLELVSSRGWFSKLAVQDVSLYQRGVHTGEISTEILKSLGVRLAIVGHSERRAMGETAEAVSKKARFAIRAGITPLICFGERERDHDGEHFEFLRHELRLLLAGISKKDAKKICLAYEPTWAIGRDYRGVVSPEDLSETVVFVKKILSDIFGRRIAEAISILYGGSVEPANVEKLSISGIGGFLIGHASLKAKSIELIVKLL